MPHKRAKASARQAARTKAGQDNAPTMRDSIDYESAHVSKTAYRCVRVRCRTALTFAGSSTLSLYGRRSGSGTPRLPSGRRRSRRRCVERRRHALISQNEGLFQPKIKPHESLKAFGQYAQLRSQH